MSARHIDELLEQALATGRIPADLSGEERAELERLLRAAGASRTLRAAADAESGTSLPIARARFQRHMAQTGAAPAARPDAAAAAATAGFLVRAFGRRRLMLAGSAAAIGLIAVAAAVLAQPFSGVETASALALNENDFAQVEGVVSATSGEGFDKTVTVQSDFGEIEVAVTRSTAVDRHNQGAERASIAPGDVVTVAGPVTKKARVTSIAAVTLAVTAQPQPAPDVPKVRELRKLGAALEGRISVLTVSGDGKTARVLIDAGNGEHFVVRVGADSLGQLLAGTNAPIGVRVRVSQERANPPGEFTLTVVGSPSAGAARSPLAPIRGVVLSRQLNVIRVQTDRGVAAVVIRPQTRIITGPASGLTVAGVREGDTAAGHEIAVQGSLDRATGRVVAEVIWAGPKAPR